MSGNHSLEDFAESERPADPTGSDDRGAATGGSGGGAGESNEVEATRQWVSGGAPCGECGTEVQERWRHEDAFVCVDCKPW